MRSIQSSVAPATYLQEIADLFQNPECLVFLDTNVLMRGFRLNRATTDSHSASGCRGESLSRTPANVIARIALIDIDWTLGFGVEADYLEGLLARLPPGLNPERAREGGMPIRQQENRSEQEIIEALTQAGCEEARLRVFI